MNFGLNLKILSLNGAVTDVASNTRGAPFNDKYQIYFVTEFS